MFDKIEDAISDLKKGKMIIVVDDENRENEGDIVTSCEKITPEDMNFIITHARGLVCTPISQEIASKLNLTQMVENNTDNHSTAFTVSIDHINTTTGISADERAYTANMLAKENSKPNDFRRPGHIFPLLSKTGGVLERNGHTEATVDLMKLAGLKPCGVCCEIIKEDGTMARLDDLIEFSKKHNLKIISIEDLIKYIRNKTRVKKAVETKLVTKYGEFNVNGYVDEFGKEHLALYIGDITSEEPILCRVHSECLTGDALGSEKCDCGQQYDEAMRKIAEKGRGILIYLRQEGRGIGLINKLKAYELQRKGLDTVEANIKLGFPEDMRDYHIAADILKDLNIKNIILMSNNPDKFKKLKELNINISSREPIVVKHSKNADFYMETKKNKMGHLL